MNNPGRCLQLLLLLIVSISLPNCDSSESTAPPVEPVALEGSSPWLALLYCYGNTDAVFQSAFSKWQEEENSAVVETHVSVTFLSYAGLPKGFSITFNGTPVTGTENRIHTSMTSDHVWHMDRDIASGFPTMNKTLAPVAPFEILSPRNLELVRGPITLRWTPGPSSADSVEIFVAPVPTKDTSYSGNPFGKTILFVPDNGYYTLNVEQMREIPAGDVDIRIVRLRWAVETIEGKTFAFIRSHQVAVSFISE